MDPSSRLESENRQLRRAVSELSVLNELAAAIGGERDPDQIMRRMVSRAVSTVHCEQGVVTLIDDTEVNASETLVRSVSNSHEYGALRPDDNILGWMLIHRQPLVVNSPGEDPRFRGTNFDDRIKSLCCVPLLLHGRTIGILTLYNKHSDGGFDEHDTRLLSILASQSAQVLENARLYKEEQDLTELRQQMEVARNIQIGLLPATSPTFPGFDVAGLSRPALRVGGDFYNSVVANDSVYIWVGDVSGKGLPASLTMANAQAVLHSHAEAGRSIEECASIANSYLCAHTPRSTFVTLAMARILPDGDLRICNAGHCKPILLRADGTVEQILESDLVLGAIRNRVYTSVANQLEPGDSVVLYSDGVPEAMNADRELLGDDAPIETARMNHSLSAQEIVDSLTELVDRHAGDAEQADDITVLVAKRLAN